MIEVLHKELEGIVRDLSADLAEVCAIRGMYERLDALTVLCRQMVRRSTLCLIGGELHYFGGRCYEPADRDSVVADLGNILVDRGVSPSDVRRMSDMPLLVVMEKDYGKQSLLCFRNGVLDLIHGSRFEEGFTPSKVVTECLSYRYDADAECPLWDAFLEEVLPDGPTRRVLQEFCGMVYIDRARISIEKFAIFVGRGANGKSVIFEVLKRVLGEDNVSTLDSSQLIKENMIPYVKGKRLNFSPDVRRSSDFDSALKALASGQEVTGRRIYGEAEKIKCPPLVFALNEMPRFLDVTPAFFRRVLLFHFSVQIPPERQDRELVGKICQKELPGIFNWIMEGRRRLLRNGGQFSPSPEMDRSLALLQSEMLASAFPVRAFLIEKGYDIAPIYKGQPFTYFTQNEIYYGLKGAVTRNAITRELSAFGVPCSRGRELRYKVYEREIRK